MSVQSDLGPAMLPAGVAYQRAREIEQLAARAAEFARRGPQQDMALVQKQFDRIRAIMGGGDG